MNEDKIKPIKAKTKLIKAINYISIHRYMFFYFIILIILTSYILQNWDRCISMQFFRRFNGNNILFIVWIVMILLIFYDVDGKGLKLHMKQNRKMEEQLNLKQMEYQFNVIREQIKKENIDNGDENK